MSVLVAKQSHFEKIRGTVGNVFAVGKGNCGTCNCSGCANCGGTGGCASRCDVGNCNCGTHRFEGTNIGEMLKDFFSK